MSKLARLLTVASVIWKLVAHYPAATAAVFNVIIVIGAAFGLHFTPEQLATTASIVAVIFGALVHENVIPMSKVKKDSAEPKPNA